MIWQFCIFFLIRSLIGYLQQTYDHPDEYWQSLEIAHKMVFPNGIQSWEWEQENAIRGPLHPYIFALIYKLLAILNLDKTFLFIFIPLHILRPLIGSLWDYALVLLTQELRLNKYINTILLLNYLSLGGLIYPTRLYSNVIEGILMVFSLYFWIKIPPIHIKQDSLIFQKQKLQYEIISRLFITFNFLIRCTSLSAWPLVFIYRLIVDRQRFKQHIIINILHVFYSLLISLLLDFSFYKKITLSSFNFLYFNFLSQQSQFFGEEPWYYYFLKYIPEMLVFAYPFFYYGIYNFYQRFQKFLQKKKYFESQQIIEIFIAISSFLFLIQINVHKEQRFLVGMYLVITIIASVGLQKGIKKLEKNFLKDYMILKRMIKLSLILIHLLICIQRFKYKEMDFNIGNMKFVYYFRNEKMNELLLMTKCYPSPLNSIIHRPVQYFMVSCAPTDSNEQQLFFEDPSQLFQNQFQKTNQFLKRKVKAILLDNYSIFSLFEVEKQLKDEKLIQAYQSQYLKMSNFLIQNGYKLEKQFRMVYHSKYQISIQIQYYVLNE